MKRTLLSLILSIAMGISYAAELNIYASSLKLHNISPENRKASISYFLNAPATAVEFQLLDANQSIVHTIALNDPGYLTKGQHDNVEIDLFGIRTGEYSWAIKATATNQTNALTHINSSAVYKDKYYSPRGLTVDNSTESPYLGRIYIAESKGGVTTKFNYNRTTDEGIYILNPMLNDINYGTGNYSGDLAYDGGVSWDSGTNGPFRITADKDGYLYICDNGSSTSGVWRMNPAHPEHDFEEVLATSRRGTNYNRIGSIVITEEGDHKAMFAIDNNMEIGNNSVSHLKRFALSTLPNSAAGDNLIDLCDVVVANNAIVSDNRNGFWIFQNRSSRDVYPAILHYRYSDGEYIQDINTSTSGEQKSMVPESAPNNGGCGALSHDGRLLAFYGNERILIYSIGYDSDGKPTTVDKIHDLNTGYTTINAMAFDIANNLYMVSNVKERFYAYALRETESTPNTHTTPAPSSQRITLAEPIPHIMAYNLDVKQNGKYYDFTFYANTNATSGKLLFYDNTETLKGEVTINQSITKGENTFKILTHEIPDGVDMTWKLQLSGADNEAFGIVYESPTILQRAHAAIDNSPESDYFGRMYVADRVTSNIGECHIYNYDYNKKVLTDLTCGIGTFVSAARPAVDTDGFVYWAAYGDLYGGIYVMNPNTLISRSFFDGEQATSGLWTNTNEVEIGSSCCAVSIYGSGANTKLFAMNEDAGETLVENGYLVYNIGQSDGTIRRTWNEAPSQKITVADNGAHNFSIVGTSRGAWLCQNRCKNLNEAGAYSLMFYGNNGKRHFYSDTLSGYFDGSYGAGMAVSADETKLAMINGSGGIQLFDIEWNYSDAEGCDVPTVTLITTYRTPYKAISSMHFDYAGNLVTMAGTSYATYDQLGNKISEASDMRLVVFSTPTDNNTTTIPARTRLTVSNKLTLLDTEDNTEVLEEHKDQIQNASVFRSLTAGMYNTLCLPFSLASFTGTPLEDATVWQYNGATVENEATNKEIFLNFEEVTAIEAGKPYLVEPATDIAAPMEFKDVTISVTNGSNVAQSAVTMHGILHPTELQADDKSILFLVANNNLAWANVTANMNGMRAYFKVNDPSLLSARTRAYIKREPTVTTDMENITTTETEIKKVIYNNNLYILRGEEVYTIQGNRIK